MPPFYRVQAPDFKTAKKVLEKAIHGFSLFQHDLKSFVQAVTAKLPPSSKSGTNVRISQFFHHTNHYLGLMGHLKMIKLIIIMYEFCPFWPPVMCFTTLLIFSERPSELNLAAQHNLRSCILNKTHFAWHFIAGTFSLVSACFFLL